MTTIIDRSTSGGEGSLVCLECGTSKEIDPLASRAEAVQASRDFAASHVCAAFTREPDSSILELRAQ